jgi:CRISPR-associated endoribonuclease Cas6
MRLKIHLQTTANSIIPINYQHSLQGLIYSALKYGNEEFAGKLHAEGYLTEESTNTRQNFKFFCFSGIAFRNKYLLDDKKENFILRASQEYPSEIVFSVSSPKEDFIQHLVNGLFRQGNEVNFANNSFVVSKILTEAPSEPPEEVILKPMFSPIVMKSNKLQLFLTYEHPEIEELLINNLCSKHKLLHPEQSQEITKGNIEIKFLPSLMAEKAPKTKLITFKTQKDGKTISIKTKGNFVPVRIKASKQVIQTALDCGLGEKNSSGFGFVEIMKI